MVMALLLVLELRCREWSMGIPRGDESARRKYLGFAGWQMRFDGISYKSYGSPATAYAGIDMILMRVLIWT